MKKGLSINANRKKVSAAVVGTLGFEPRIDESALLMTPYLHKIWSPSPYRARPRPQVLHERVAHNLKRADDDMKLSVRLNDPHMSNSKVQ